MDDAAQSTPRPNGRVTRFPTFEPWRDPRRRDGEQRRQRPQNPPPPAAPAVRIKAPPPPITFGATGKCRLGIHQLNGINRRVIAGRVVCQECFQGRLRLLG